MLVNNNKYKYIKYKTKYINLKQNNKSTLLYGGINILEDCKEINDKGEYICMNGDDMVCLTNYLEYSRFDTKKKEVKHWYAKIICEQIIKKIKELNYFDKTEIKILVLGVALGGIIIHLLDKLSNSNITGVDISNKYFEIVKKYSPKDRLKLITFDANKYIEIIHETYDFIICDIFIENIVCDFVLSDKFLNNINNKLTINGLFLINIVEKNKYNLEEKLKIYFNNYELIENQNYYNIIGICNKF